jgi:hypothetical protein
MMKLDDHMLKDIGLTRSEIHAAAHGLLDRGPASEPIRPQRMTSAWRGAWFTCSALLSRAVRLLGPTAVAILIWANPTAWAADEAAARLPTIEDLPPGVVRVSPSPSDMGEPWARGSPGMREHWARVSPPVPGMGEHWAKPQDLPLGPIYCVMDGKVICAEFMVAQEDLLMGRSFERLRLGMKGRLPPVDHLELNYMPHGHEGYETPHYDVHMYFVPPEARFREETAQR